MRPRLDLDIRKDEGEAGEECEKVVEIGVGGVEGVSEDKEGVLEIMELVVELPP